MGARKSHLNSVQSSSDELKDTEIRNAIISLHNSRNNKDKENRNIYSRSSSFSMKNNNDFNCLCRNVKSPRPQRKYNDLSACNNTRYTRTSKQQLDETQILFEKKARAKAVEIPAKLKLSHGSEKHRTVCCNCNCNCSRTRKRRSYGVEPRNGLQDISPHSEVRRCSTCNGRMEELSEAEAIARAITEYCCRQRQKMKDKERNRHRRWKYNYEQMEEDGAEGGEIEENIVEEEVIEEEKYIVPPTKPRRTSQNSTRGETRNGKGPSSGHALAKGCRCCDCKEEQSAKEQSEIEEISIEHIELEVQVVRTEKMERDSVLALQSGHRPFRRHSQGNKIRPRSHLVEEPQIIRNNNRKQSYKEHEQSGEEKSEGKEISVDDIKLEVQEQVKGCRRCDCKKKPNAEEQSEVENTKLEVQEVRTEEVQRDWAVPPKSGHRPFRRYSQENKTKPRSNLVEEPRIIINNIRRLSNAEEEHNAEGQSEREEISVENIELEVQEVRTEKMERDLAVAPKPTNPTGHQPLRKHSSDNKTRSQSHLVKETLNTRNNIQRQHHAKGCLCCNCKEERELREIMYQENENEVLVNKTNLETRSEEESICKERKISSVKNIQNIPQPQQNEEEPQYSRTSSSSSQPQERTSVDNRQFSATDIEVEVKTKTEADNKGRLRRSVEDESRNRLSSIQASQERMSLVSMEERDIPVQKQEAQSQQSEALKVNKQSVSAAEVNAKKLQNCKIEEGRSSCSYYKNGRSAEEKNSKQRHPEQDGGKQNVVEGLANRFQRHAEQQIAQLQRLQEEMKTTQSQQQRCCCDTPPCCFPPYPFCEPPSEQVTMSFCEDPRPPTRCFQPTSCCYLLPSCSFSPPPCCYEPPTCFVQECRCGCQPMIYCYTASYSYTKPGPSL